MLVFYTPDNRPGKHDGDEFKREATKFCALHDDAEPVALRGTRKQRFAAFAEACEDRTGQGLLDVVYFGHGVARGLPHLCTARMVPDFAARLALCIEDGADIVFNSCLCAKEFTQALVDELARIGLGNCRATGHTTAGHTTRNPNLAESTAAMGTRRYCKPGTRQWREWRAWLAAGAHRFYAPWMSPGDVGRMLGAQPAGVKTLHDGDEVLPPDWRCPGNVKNQW